MKKFLGSATCVLYILLKGDHNLLFFCIFPFINFFLYCKWYAIFSFCRKSTLHYIIYYYLLLNLVKQMQWKH